MSGVAIPGSLGITEYHADQAAFGERRASREGQTHSVPLEPAAKKARKDPEPIHGTNKDAKIPKGSFMAASPMVGEMKCFDTSVVYKNTSVPVGTQPAGTFMQSLNLLPAGAGQGERVGRRITVHSIEMLGFRCLSTNNGYGIPNSIILFVDTQANGDIPLPTDVMTSSPDMSRAFINVSNYQRFFLLHRLDTMTNQIDPTINPCYPIHYLSHSNLNIPIDFSDTSANLSAVRSNNIICLVAGRANLTEQVSVQVNFRICYTDS